MADVETAETGWLIERIAEPGCEWWNGQDWTRDPFDAVRYARKLDADRAIERDLFCTFTGAFATDHMWYVGDIDG